MSRTEELWDLIWEDEEEPEESPPVSPRRGGSGERARAGRRGRWRKVAWWTAVVVVAAVSVTAARAVWPTGSGEDAASPAAGPATERAVAWTLRSPKDPGEEFVAVLVPGEGRATLAMPIPVETVTTLPGRAQGTVRDAVISGDATLMGTLTENMVGLHMAHSVVMTMEELEEMVDSVGRIEVDGRMMNGAQTARYLSKGDAAGPEGFYRWQVVLAALVPAAQGEVPGSVPEGLREVLSASAGSPVDVIGFPVVEGGSGLLTPDEEALDRLLAQRFGPEVAGEQKARLVVLNGVGTPGIGAEVARILVPEGFELVANLNASSFDEKETKIVAASQEDLKNARKAQLLLGVGEVLLGNQPTGLADVTVVIGADFGGA